MAIASTEKHREYGRPLKVIDDLFDAIWYFGSERDGYATVLTIDTRVVKHVDGNSDFGDGKVIFSVVPVHNVRFLDPIPEETPPAKFEVIHDSIFANETNVDFSIREIAEQFMIVRSITFNARFHPSIRITYTIEHIDGANRAAAEMFIFNKLKQLGLNQIVTVNWKWSPYRI